MKITHKISMDLDRYSVPGFDAVCGDRNTRELEIALYAGGTAWEIPAEVSVSVRYQKPDGTSGSYDLLPDGTVAWGISGNVVTVVPAPQTLTAPGCVILTVCLTAGERVISTFQILMNVRPAVGLEASASGDYWYLSGSLPQPVDAVVGEVLVVESVDSQGRVTGLKAGGVPGLTEDQFRALAALLKLASYTEDPAPARAALYAAFGLGIPATGISLSSNILVLSEGTSHQLTATVTPEDTTEILVWSTSDPAVATVSDGLVASVGQGECTVTATAGAVSASCSVTVSPAMQPHGLADASGSEWGGDRLRLSEHPGSGLKKIYISPSDQTENLYAAGNTNEAVQCRKIAGTLMAALGRCGFAAMTNAEGNMYDRVGQSNDWGADLHLCVHTNAHDGSVKGTRLFCYDLAGEGYRVCRAVMDALAPITPGESDSITVKHFYEVRCANAPTVYLEVAFHDNPEEAAWIVTNTAAIAEAVCRGICTHYGVDYVPPEEILYRVQVGAFRVRENALKLLEVLKAAGYADAFITTPGGE